MGQFAPSISDTMQYVVSANGATVQCNNTTTLLLLNRAGTIATLTVVLPLAPVDGQRLTVAAGAAITILNITGATIKGTMATMALNSYARFAYSVDAGFWFRAG